MNTYLPPKTVKGMAAAFGGDAIALALSLLDEAARFAVVPVSGFRVGAVAIDDQGAFYFGANQESAAAMAQTVHAEQSAVAHAWMRGAARITHMVVNHTPCGHCRQFLNELRGSEGMLIHLPHRRDNRLADYLPDSFGPADLDLDTRLLDPQQHAFRQPEDADELLQAAIAAAARSHAPYSRAYAGVALQCADGQIFGGSYAENAAFNPSLPPLQTALNLLRLSGYRETDITAAALACTDHGGHREHTLNLWTHIGNARPLHVHTLEPL